MAMNFNDIFNEQFGQNFEAFWGQADTEENLAKKCNVNLQKSGTFDAFDSTVGTFVDRDLFEEALRARRKSIGSSSSDDESSDEENVSARRDVLRQPSPDPMIPSSSNQIREDFVQKSLGQKKNRRKKRKRSTSAISPNQNAPKIRKERQNSDKSKFNPDAQDKRIRKMPPIK